MSDLMPSDYAFLGSAKQLNRFSAKKPIDFCKCTFDRFFKKRIFHILSELNLYEYEDRHNLSKLLDTLSQVEKASKLKEHAKIHELLLTEKITKDQADKQHHNLHKAAELEATKCFICMNRFFGIYHDCFSDNGKFNPSYMDTINMMGWLVKFGRIYERFCTSIKRTAGAKKTNKAQEKEKLKIMKIIGFCKITPSEANKDTDKTCKKIRKEYKNQYEKSLPKDKIKNSTLLKYVDERCYPLPWPPKK